MSDSSRVRNVAHRNSQNRGFRSWSTATITLIFIAVLALGYIGGMYHKQVLAMIGPVLGINTYAGELDLSSVQTTYQMLKANYDGEIDDAALIEGANRGLVDAVDDPYTVYLSTEESEEFDDELSGKIGGGIGAEIGIRGDQPTVIRVVDGNPAKEVGLLAGDRLLKVNDESVVDKTVNEVVSKIRGDVGTTVKLEVARGNETKEFNITRREVNNPSVYTQIDGKIGIMTISRFDEQTASLARTAAQEFKKSKVEKVIVDVRNNYGGYLDAARQIAGLWLNNKLVVTEKSHGIVTAELKSSSNPVLAGMKTVVLVNDASASASEILAGALRDNNAAILIGETTYGKGSVQKLFNLGDGSQLKITIAKWYTPNGNNINQQGIKPDKVVEMTDDDYNYGRDPQLVAAKQFLLANR